MALAAQPTSSRSQGNKSSKGKPFDSRSTSTKQRASASANSAGNKSCGECGEPSEGELSETIAELAEVVEALEKADDGEKADECCEQCDKLGNELKKLAICRRAESRLCKLCRCCGECQSNVAVASPNAGGLKAGWGTNTARRNERDALVDNGQTTQLKGLKGSGPSLTSVEAADSGSGVSHRRGAARQREFKHQFESFVQREDVPEAVRDGVKQYFEIIHEADKDASPKGNSKE